MIENIEIIRESVLSYIGMGGHAILYVFSLIYILIKEKDKQKKCFLCYFQIFMLFIILNPIFNKLVGGFFNNKTYVRLLWIIPNGIIIAYVLVDIIEHIENKIKKNVIMILSIIIIGITGKLIYMDGNFIKVNNIYKLPEESVEVTHIISNDDSFYKKAYVPPEILAHIRQINADVLLTYERNPNSYDLNDFVIALKEGSAQRLNYLAKREKSNYIVTYKNVELIGSFEEYNYEKIGETDNYIIYKYTGDMLYE